MSTRDELAARLRAAAVSSGYVVKEKTAEYATSQWEPFTAIQALGNELATILAEQAAEIASLKARIAAMEPGNK